MELTVDTEYYLKYTLRFCHTSDNLKFEPGIYTFVGKISTHLGDKNIFYKSNTNLYVMFSTDSIDYIVDPYPLLKDIPKEVLEKELERRNTENKNINQ